MKGFSERNIGNIAICLSISTNQFQSINLLFKVQSRHQNGLKSTSGKRHQYIDEAIEMVS